MSATAGMPRARALSSALREARLASGIGVRELGRMLDYTHVEISNWETGKRVPKIETVAAILATLRVTAGERDRVLDLARNVHEPNWLTVGLNGIPQQLAGAVECERAASAIVEWAPMLIPGLLQTLDYSRAIKKSSGLSDADTELRVMLSASRREVIVRRIDPVSFNAFIGEAALFEPIGPREVMLEQLDQLLELAGRSNVAVRIMPLRVGWHPGLLGPFVLYEFDDISPVVHFEHYSSGAFIPAEHDVNEYRSAVQQIESLAMDRKDSAEFVLKAKAKWER
ncbi:helix-turn-helix domain-containing protein [Saccharopolyspora shandongensis]|uniref:Helix-turn-helix domain-containing protein n=1 Tax=Saccharopolyspora shandongensis TaxID=418495 RepID=A0A1H3JR43_9PSEU|nr:helix-turn-helix transcriptional regulator [Saccharopolyspora shandongensis]SDY42403.1 Helix-turn-helix domain-containing protein [Saccharopolyspora shandongensis]